MSGTTTNPEDNRRGHGSTSVPAPQHEVHLVLTDEELAKGFVRPVRDSYIHNKCNSKTTMPWKVAETYARDPEFYGTTYCCSCLLYLPVKEFKWLDGQVLGS